jgi:vacuolar-type H+-ATPase subunit C/Vma6
MPLLANDLDHVAARLHGRRSRLGEGARLDALGRLRTLGELAHACWPDAEPPSTTQFQRHLVGDLLAELTECLAHLGGAGARLVDWLRVRFQVENLKVLLRGVATHTPLAGLHEFLLPLPRELALDPAALRAAESWTAFGARLPTGPLRRSLAKVAIAAGDNSPPFFLEAALDRSYFQELIARGSALAGEDKEVIAPLLQQEVDIFHLMLVGRGKFQHGLAPELLLPLQVAGTRISRARQAAMLAAPDLAAVAQLAMGSGLDALPAPRSGANTTTVEPAALEALAWNRLLRLANRAFRRSHLGLGTVVGYAFLRRVEVANLITLSEGLRAGLTSEAIGGRMLPRAELEAAHV